MVQTSMARDRGRSLEQVDGEERAVKSVCVWLKTRSGKPACHRQGETVISAHFEAFCSPQSQWPGPPARGLGLGCGAQPRSLSKDPGAANCMVEENN